MRTQRRARPLSDAIWSTPCASSSSSVLFWRTPASRATPRRRGRGRSPPPSAPRLRSWASSGRSAGRRLYRDQTLHLCGRRESVSSNSTRSQIFVWQLLHRFFPTSVPSSFGTTARSGGARSEGRHRPARRGAQGAIAVSRAPSRPTASSQRVESPDRRGGRRAPPCGGHRRRGRSLESCRRTELGGGDRSPCTPTTRSRRRHPHNPGTTGTLVRRDAGGSARASPAQRGASGSPRPRSRGVARRLDLGARP